MMMADGELIKGGFTRSLTHSPVNTNLPDATYMSEADRTGNYTGIWRGINLLGNPYQSYLDFSESGGKAPSIGTYAILDESLPGNNHYLYYTQGQSRNVPLYASGIIHPHQGFFVQYLNGFTFTESMRKAGNSRDVGHSTFRGQKDYLLVNLLCYDEDGERDLTTVEVNRPELGGGHKMERLHESKGRIYANFEDESYQILFAPEGTHEVPVRFVAEEDGVFTLNWNTLHGNFSYLHLIDNMTGVDLDMLTNSEYKFEGKTTDYKSRFKLVFRCEDEEEPDDPEDPDDDEEDDDSFAFQFGDELIVNGEGLFQLFDLNGRCLIESHAVGGQSRFSVPNVAAGVYLLRLTTDKKVKVQKMIINSI